MPCGAFWAGQEAEKEKETGIGTGNGITARLGCGRPRLGMKNRNGKVSYNFSEVSYNFSAFVCEVTYKKSVLKGEVTYKKSDKSS
jgi:hypothetical protein